MVNLDDFRTFTKKMEMNCVGPDMIDLAVTVCNRYAAGKPVL